MLFGQNFGRCQQRGLMTTLHRNQHCTHRNNGLSRTNVTLQQTMHGVTFGEVFVDLANRSSLRSRQLIRKHIVKTLH